MEADIPPYPIEAGDDIQNLRPATTVARKEARIVKNPLARLTEGKKKV